MSYITRTVGAEAHEADILRLEARVIEALHRRRREEEENDEPGKEGKKLEALLYAVWGSNSHGQCLYPVEKDQLDEPRLLPAGPLPLPSLVKQVHCGGTSSAVLLDNGDVTIWGAGRGIWTTTGLGASHLALGHTHAATVTADGAVLMCDLMEHDALIDGTLNPGQWKLVPLCDTVRATLRVVMVAVGVSHFAAVIGEPRTNVHVTAVQSERRKRVRLHLGCSTA
jgi:alpha-tubulin suppressor-like RCC1 family protein